MTGAQRIVMSNALLLTDVKQQISNGHNAIIRLKGYSMRPFVENERDMALLFPVETGELNVNDAVLAEIAPNHYVLHRIIRLEGNHVTLMGDGNVGVTEHCKRTDVIAKVRAFIRKGHSRPDYTDGWKWRVYSAIWTRTVPLRRYLLFAYRLLHPRK